MRPIGSTSGSKYPQPTAEVSAEIVRRLAGIVSLYHGETLSPAQLDAVRICVTAQVAAAERLHRFPLANDREPMFTVNAGFPG
ncbi:MAG: hypothetical protein JWQ81_1148 [Amycolatopsis sp.]|jgi:hypothetical protein|uniref:hypothetical protein n=1 Tax=Amycolatopsis sp. TaxID=37632 RepID=UPI00260FD42B|nr:hypothetical protein [Amycolatopsis sp.]MCU1680409.1 hypothetical protein [Amycolatopsis sp.]